MSAMTVSLETAQQLDAVDPFRKFREQFFVPKKPDGSEEVYFVGNSLGLQPKQTRQFLEHELSQWENLGVRGHFEGEFPWMPYHEFLTAPMAEIVGGRDNEVVMMNSLTVNLHLMLTTFYRPQGNRRKILIEDHAFPSDFHAVESRIRLSGLEPEDAMLRIYPDERELISTDSVLSMMEDHADELALVLLPGVQYYTGQLFDMERITAAAHEHGIIAGFDLAHAAGNVPMKLHDWNVDFAVWCSYKYLNSGPGSVGGCFVHEQHASNIELPRMAGWWGHEKSSRFRMENEFTPIPTVEGWQLSNPPILSLAAIRSSLDVFQKAGGVARLREKSLQLTAFFEQCLSEKLGDAIRIITPSDPNARGCQLSLAVVGEGIEGKAVYEKLEANGIRTDWREPNGIRCAPVPLYNSFEDVWEFVDMLSECCR